MVATWILWTVVGVLSALVLVTVWALCRVSKDADERLAQAVIRLVEAKGDDVDAATGGDGRGLAAPDRGKDLWNLLKAVDVLTFVVAHWLQTGDPINMCFLSPWNLDAADPGGMMSPRIDIGTTEEVVRRVAEAGLAELHEEDTLFGNATIRATKAVGEVNGVVVTLLATRRVET